MAMYSAPVRHALGVVMALPTGGSRSLRADAAGGCSYLIPYQCSLQVDNALQILQCCLTCTAPLCGTPWGC